MPTSTKASRIPKIFIVYQMAELELVRALADLLHAWGYEAFHCRIRGRDQEQYRKDLREHLVTSDVAILVLSLNFQWSAYCQSEAGTIMAMEMPFIPILVPPIGPEDVRDLVPVLEGMDVVSLGEPTFVEILQNEIRAKFAQTAGRRAHLLRRLSTSSKVPRAMNSSAATDVLTELRNRVVAEGESASQQYRFHQPEKSLIGRWPNLTVPSCRESVIRNIVASLIERDGESTIDIAGISLKFSLKLLIDAFEQIGQKDLKAPKRKKLTLRLVHMDPASHILHAIGDLDDLKFIRNTYLLSWAELVQKWGAVCAHAGIDLGEPVVGEIDFIPPAIGMLIDKTILYLGQCSFIQVGALEPPSFHLHAGENAYTMWISDGAEYDSFAAKAIRAFSDSFHAYLAGGYSGGVAAVYPSDIWLQRLSDYLYASTAPWTVTFVSSSGTKFEPLIKKACSVATEVRVFISSPGPAKSKQVASRKRSMYLKEFGRDLMKALSIQCFTSPAPFRCVIIADRVIGIQPYMNPNARAELLAGAPKDRFPLCFIITPRCSQFREIRDRIEKFANICC